MSDYLNCFKSDVSKLDVMDELEFHYEDMDAEDRKHRFEMMHVIAAPGAHFDDPEEYDESPDDDIV